MSSNKGSSTHPKPPDDLAREGQRIQELVEKIGALHDPAARRMLQECLESVLSFYGHGLERILGVIEKIGPDGEKAREALIDDPGVRGLLLIHGLHPISLEARLTEALDKVRPYMESHGGNVELLSLENDYAKLRLVGHCKTCPSSTVTLELAVRAAIEEACPDLAGFEVEGIQNDAGSVEKDDFEHVPGTGPIWTRIENASEITNDNFLIIRPETESILVCRVDDQLYAYRDHCPACNLPLHLGEIINGVIKCNIGHGFNVKRAGVSTDKEGMHLDPLPLLTQVDGTAKVAIAPLATTGKAGAVHL
jgi:Fe-S cluster biogenesis protein NfuA/nitrite reductase/ring-hydroxylating ferredoxin subunit